MYKVMVRVQGESELAKNGERFATYKEALDRARGIKRGWSKVIDWEIHFDIPLSKEE